MIAEVTVRLNPDKTFNAAHVRDEKGYPLAIDATVLPALFDELNVAAIAHVDFLTQEITALTEDIKGRDAAHETLKAEFSAFKAAVTQAAESARKIIADDAVDAVESCAMVDAIAAKMLKNKAERDLEAADQAIADAIAARDQIIKAFK